MKKFLDNEQVNKLVELELIETNNDNVSIYELLDLLPTIVVYSDDRCYFNSCRDYCKNWICGWMTDGFDSSYFLKEFCSSEYIDAIFEMVIWSKENIKVIIC